MVERAVDILSIEKSGTFRGKFHVLGGKISPLDGVEPDDLSIGALEKRLTQESIKELIIALGTDVEGDATSHYLAKRLARKGLKISRIAYGLPAGSGLEFADELTLSRALEGRREMTNEKTDHCCFRLGQGIGGFRLPIAISRLAARSKRRWTESKSFWDNPTPSLIMKCGRLTREEFYEQARKATGFRGTLEEFGEFFANIFTAIPPMIELHAGLRQRGIPTYIFSNTNDLAVEHIRRNFPFFREL